MSNKLVFTTVLSLAFLSGSALAREPFYNLGGSEPSVEVDYGALRAIEPPPAPKKERKRIKSRTVVKSDTPPKPMVDIDGVYKKKRVQKVEPSEPHLPPPDLEPAPPPEPVIKEVTPEPKKPAQKQPKDIELPDLPPIPGPGDEVKPSTTPPKVEPLPKIIPAPPSPEEEDSGDLKKLREMSREHDKKASEEPNLPPLPVVTPKEDKPEPSKEKPLTVPEMKDGSELPPLPPLPEPDLGPTDLGKKPSLPPEPEPLSAVKLPKEEKPLPKPEKLEKPEDKLELPALPPMPGEPEKPKTEAKPEPAKKPEPKPAAEALEPLPMVQEKPEKPAKEAAKKDDMALPSVDDLPSLPKLDTSSSPASGGSVALSITLNESESELPISEQERVASIAKKLVANPKLKATIFTYASGTGEQDIQATKLSMQRGRSVKAFLVNKGVDESRVIPRPMGNRAESGPADRIDISLSE